MVQTTGMLGEGMHIYEHTMKWSTSKADPMRRWYSC